MDNTIVAIATPTGIGAISVIRLSGSASLAIIAKCFTGTKKLARSPRKAILGSITDTTGENIDEVLATYFPNPASFTGEDTIELSTHGGVYVTQAVLKRLLECGADAADPGEFTQRAFLNGKLDLTQAEGIMDIISAQSDLALRAAQNQLHGSIQAVTAEMREALIEVTAHLEAFIDFPEDDIDPETGLLLTKRLGALLSKCESLLSTSYTGKLLREGARVVLCGEPNAGKSSLLNALLGYDRAIVSEIAGTTRDTVEEIVDIGGLPIKFIDTAGLRETEQVIEQEGINRAYKEMESADLIIEVIDGTLPPSKVERAKIPPKVRHLVLLNKEDERITNEWEKKHLRVSCKKANGLKDLPKTVSELLLDGNQLTGSSLIAINARHQGCLNQIRTSLQNALQEITSQEDPELISVTLREALNAIGELTGRVDTEEILGQIFAQFCIGK